MQKIRAALFGSFTGLFLYQMTPSTFVRLLIAKVCQVMHISVHYKMDFKCRCTHSMHTQPSIIPRYLKHLHSLLPKLDISTLLRVARLFDPSLPTIGPLLVKAHSHRQR